MNLDYIDFYHVWCVMSLEEYGQRKLKGVLKTFERLKDRGLIRHISISTHARGAEIEKILADYPFESVLLGYSAMNFAYRQQGLDAAAKQNCAVAVMNPLGGGLIPKNPNLFSFLKTRRDETVAEAALRFLLNDRRITVVLVGFSNLQQIDEAVSAVDGFRPIATQTIQKIRAGLSESFNQLCTACGYCDDCPQKINVPGLMDAYNHLILGGSAARPHALLRKAKQWGAGGQDLIGCLQFNWGYDLDDDFLSECTQCGCCEKKCTQNLPICERLQIIRSEVGKFLHKEDKKGKNSTKN
jgi:predicted aldo/keto reductase-like oxidoreductase